MLSNWVRELAEKVLAGGRIEFGEAERLYFEAEQDELLFWANRLRRAFKGKTVDFCSIINAKSGRCPEDCKFCAQSAHYRTSAPVYPLVSEKRLLKGMEEARRARARRYGIVVSGRRINSARELEMVCRALEAIRRMGGIGCCASLGELTAETARRLKASGLERYHHNLETSEEFFPQVCSTHSFADRVRTVRLAKEAGLEVCCGGIFGLGERPVDRLSLAFTLRELEVDSVPLNFLVPIPGTPLEGQPPLAPQEILRIVALFRFVLPRQDIKVCGGRERNLRDLQSWLFYAGANGALIGNYLTTPGRPPEEDWQMVADLELEIPS